MLKATEHDFNMLISDIHHNLTTAATIEEARNAARKDPETDYPFISEGERRRSALQRARIIYTVLHRLFSSSEDVNVRDMLKTVADRLD